MHHLNAVACAMRSYALKKGIAPHSASYRIKKKALDYIFKIQYFIFI